MKNAIAIAEWHTGNYKNLLTEIPTGNYSKKMLRAEKILKEQKIVKMRDMCRSLSMRKAEVQNLMELHIDDGLCRYDERNR